MEYSQFYEEYGHPFTGRKRRRLEEFLRRMNLSYDEGVQYTVNLVTQDGEIAATGSLQHTSSSAWRWMTAIRARAFPPASSPCF